MIVKLKDFHLISNTFHFLVFLLYEGGITKKYFIR